MQVAQHSNMYNIYSCGLTLRLLTVKVHLHTPYGSLNIAQPRFHASSTTQQHDQHIFLQAFKIANCQVSPQYRLRFSIHIAQPRFHASCATQ